MIPIQRLLLATLLCLPVASVHAAGGFFTPPDIDFIVAADESVFKVELSASSKLGDMKNGNNLSVESAQKVIDDARAQNPDAVLLIESASRLVVGATPLRLGSRMCLRFLPGAGIAAGSDCTAASLIEIQDSEFVSVTSGGAGLALIDGSGKQVTGINVLGGSRMNFDQLAIARCGVSGMDFKGRDAVAINQASSVTRSDFRENGYGLRVDVTGGFQCLDNNFKNNQGPALTMNSLASVVAGNEFSGNKAAIMSASDRGVIARNRIGDTVALEVTPAGVGQLITENIGTIKDLKITLAGSTQQLFRNDLHGTATIAPESKDIFLIGNTGLSADPAAPGLKLFNPPTYGHPHKDTVIVAGMGRFDLPEIQGGKVKKGDVEGIPPVDISVVQEALNAASQEHPNDVLVLKLQGEFISRSLAGLELPPNTCLILEGRILADLGQPLDPPWVRGEPVGQVIMLPKTGYSSVSGGKLDGGRQANHPINAFKGSIAVIENVNITAGMRDGINTKARNANHPLFIYRCNVYGNNARGIWAHVATRVHSIANNCVGNNSDGIDLDAFSIDCTALFNTSNGNRRHGVFIEEGVDHNIVFGNTLNDNFGAGIHTWNEEVKQNTGQNVISANECNGNHRGTSVGGRADDKTSHENLFFNNVTRYNRLNGILAGNSKAKGNYFTQCVVGQNIQQDVAGFKDAVFFNSIVP
jgi:hypothetical protein